MTSKSTCRLAMRKNWIHGAGPSCQYKLWQWGTNIGCVAKCRRKVVFLHSFHDCLRLYNGKQRKQRGNRREVKWAAKIVPFPSRYWFSKEKRDDSKKETVFLEKKWRFFERWRENSKCLMKSRVAMVKQKYFGFERRRRRRIFSGGVFRRRFLG